MEWVQYLLLLVCPLMMFFCMKGHLGGHKHDHDSDHHNDLNYKVAKLLEENAKLRKEVDDLTLMVKKES